MKNLYLILFCTALLVSCAQRIDGTSEESYRSSMENLKKSLSKEDRRKFEDALQRIAMENINSLDDLANIQEIADDLRGKLDGMAFEEVIAEGERVQMEIDEKNKEQARIEIEELYVKMKNSNEDRSELAKFHVEKSRYYKKKSGVYLISYDPILELTVINGTNQAISRAYFKGTIKSPERTIPWLVQDFNYEISGGLEPNERANWHLAPNSFSEWGTVDAPKDAIFTVEVTRLDGADGEKLFSIDFDEDDQERLGELLNDYPEFVRH